MIKYCVMTDRGRKEEKRKKRSNRRRRRRRWTEVKEKVLVQQVFVCDVINR